MLRPPHMEVKIKPGVWPDFTAMHATIQKAGYKPIPEQTEILVTGKVVRQDGQLAIELDNMTKPVTLPVTTSKDKPEAAARLEQYVGQTVEVSGMWSPAEDKAAPGVLAVTVIGKAGKK